MKQAASRARQGASTRRPDGRSGFYVSAFGMLVLGAAVTAAVWPLHRVDMPQDALPLAVLLVMGAASTGLRIQHTEEHVAFSFTAVVLISAIVLVGPGLAAVVGIATAILDARQRWGVGHVLNAGMIALMTSAAGVTYFLAGGVFLGHSAQAGGALAATGHPINIGRLLEQVGAPLLAADVALMATNVIVLLLMNAPKAEDVRELLISSLVYTVPLYLGYAIIAFILVVLWVPADVGPFAAALITAPLLVTRWVHAQYGEEKRAHRQILESLVRTGADPEVVDHAARVADVADAMAARIGLGLRARARLRHAARLHALGTRRTCDISPCADTAQSVREAVERARVAHEIVGHVDFLSEAAEAIRHQAERVDGLGGPDRLRGEEIPLFARIVAVAHDADVLLNPPSGGGLSQGEVVARLRDCAGRRYDAAAVEVYAALVRDRSVRASGTVPTSVEAAS